MKQAILVVAFGSTVDEARQNSIEPVVKHIEKLFPQHHVSLSFSSRIIVKRLRERGITVATEEGAMEQLIADGYDHIYVQPLHFTGGEEFDKLKNNLMTYADQVEVLRVGRPLVYYMAQEDHPDDYKIFIDAFINGLDIPKDEGLLLIGHGGLSFGNSSYGNLQLQLLLQGYKNVRIGVLENSPYLEETALNWEWLDGTKPTTIHLHPLLLVMGDHALNDLFGDEEDSVTSILTEAGYTVEEYHRGLGEYPSIQAIYGQHVQDIIDDCYGKRSSHRPAIPKIK